MAEKSVKKNNTGIIVGVILIGSSIVIVGGFFFIKWIIGLNKGQTNPNNNNDGGNNNTDPVLNNGGNNSSPNDGPNNNPPVYTACVKPSSYFHAASNTYPLKVGQQSDNVKTLQKALNKMTEGNHAFLAVYGKIDEDGKFGCGTQTRLAKISSMYFKSLPKPLTEVKSKAVLDLIVTISNNLSQAPVNNPGNDVSIGNGLTISDLY